MNIGCHINENLADQLVFDMSKMAGAGEAAAIGLECFAGERASLLQGIAKKRTGFLAHGMSRLPPRMERRDLGAQARPMEIGPMRRQIDPIVPGLDRRRCLEHGVHGFR
jgi:hypothetical protein